MPDKSSDRMDASFRHTAAVRILALLLFALTLISLTACAKREQVYCEIGFTLPSGYRQHVASDDFNLAFERRGNIIGINRLSFDSVMNDGLLTTHTPQRLAEIYRDRLGVNTASDIFTHEGVPYFIYTKSTAQGSYTYMPAFFRTRYAYFVFTFICKNSIDDGTRVKFLEVCESVYILPEYI